MSSPQNDPTNPRSVGFQNPGPQRGKVPVGELYFLGIGINTYQHWRDLNNAVRDMEAVKDLLVSKYGLKDERCVLLRNEEATRSSIRSQLRNYSGRLTADDSLLIYYAGHGHYDTVMKEGYLVPHEGTDDDATYIQNISLQSFFRNYDARHVLFLSDACFSGSLLVERSGVTNLVASQLTQMPSRWAICSGRHNEQVVDGRAGTHSPFAEAILDVLGTGDMPGITAAYLGQAVQEQTVSNYREQLPDYGPIYGVGDKRGQFVFWPDGQVPELISEDKPVASNPRGRGFAPPEPSVSTRSVNPPSDGPQSLAQFAQTVKAMVADDQHREAVQYMQQQLQGSQHLQDTLVLLLGRINRLQRQINQGAITDSAANVGWNRLSLAITGTLEDVKERDLKG